MPNDPKEPTWTPTEIPGLVRKKGRGATAVAGNAPSVAVNTPTQEKPPQVRKAEPVPAKNGTPAPAPAPAPAPVAAKRDLSEIIQQDPLATHEELMECLANAKKLVQRIQVAADSYYIMCDYLAEDAEPYVAVVDSIMRALHHKNPQLVPELIEEQASQIVEGWQVMAHTANRAVAICKQLAQAARADTINEELQQEHNNQFTLCSN